MKPSLAELQKIMLEGVTKGDDKALGLVRPPPNDSKEVMFGVYRNAYILRLTEFLANDHPRLKEYLGDDAFTQLSKAYAAAYPSETPNARWYARHIPDFVAAQEPWRAHRSVIDLAQIEKALNDAFDSADQPVFTLAQLQQLDPERFDQARLNFQPAVRRVRVNSNAVEIWSSLKAESAPPAPVDLTETATVLVWRETGSSRLRGLATEEAMALDAAMDGVPFGVLCEMIAVMGDPNSAAIRAATYLRQWIEAEMVSDISCD